MNAIFFSLFSTKFTFYSFYFSPSGSHLHLSNSQTVRRRISNLRLNVRSVAMETIPGILLPGVSFESSRIDSLLTNLFSKRMEESTKEIGGKILFSARSFFPFFLFFVRFVAHVTLPDFSCCFCQSD